ncbi:hypothetical protein DPMN_130188 [Dreissena polymorpha]|uniref:Uncharacterized protein n=1 Tax=Dreissena polymorpha TaxID=45954 RepID=A0A9D4H498_DREPO|nr:hypothetical protein DPMN_130188 [Dreissena polymorpha]
MTGCKKHNPKFQISALTRVKAQSTMMSVDDREQPGLHRESINMLNTSVMNRQRPARHRKQPGRHREQAGRHRSSTGAHKTPVKLRQRPGCRRCCPGGAPVNAGRVPVLLRFIGKSAL